MSEPDEYKIDRWGNISAHDRDVSSYSAEMARIQKEFQDASLRRLDARLAAKGKQDPDT